MMASSRTPQSLHHDALDAMSSVGRSDEDHGVASPRRKSVASPTEVESLTPGAAIPENLSLKQPSSSPAINLVKTESLLETADRSTPPASSGPASVMPTPKTARNGEFLHKAASHFAAAAAAATGHHHERESRMEALQVVHTTMVVVVPRMYSRTYVRAACVPPGRPQ